MASNRKFRFGPVALTTTLTTNLLNCAITSVAGPVGFTATQPYMLLTRIHVSNKSAAVATYSLWIGATGANAAGTEFIGTAIPVLANGVSDWYSSGLRMDSTDFLVGGASANSALTIEGEFELGFA